MKEYFREQADFDPLWALSSGWKAPLGRVPDFSEARVKRYRSALRGFQARVRALPRAAKGSADWLEVELLKSELALHQYHWAKGGDYTRNPLLYLNHWIHGLWYLMIRVPDEQKRLEAILRFLFTSESLLYAAGQNLKKIPQLWLNIAQKEARSFRDFLKQVHRELGKKFPARRSEITAATRRGERVMRDFQGLLKKKAPESRGVSFAIGRKHFQFLLKHSHRSTRSPEKLQEFGWEKIAETKKLLEATAQSLGKGRSWREHLRLGKKRHPSSKNLLATYRKEVHRVKGFLKRKNLVSFPKGESLRVMATPEFSRETLPFAAYLNPPMFSGKNDGVFFVTLPGPGEKSALEEHNDASLKVTTVHEAYPGHHLQFARQKKIKSFMGRNFHCPSFYEGWALYCEELMQEQGYYDGLTRLNQLRDRLWRACRVVIDVGLQTGEMSDAEAVKLLTREVGMDPRGARGEVNWYTLQPTAPQSYLTGMEQILTLRRNLQRRWGKKFTLKRFHDRLLAHGAIPLSLVEQMLYSSRP